MKLVLSRVPARTILRTTQRVLFAAGVSLLGYCAWVLADAWVFQKTETAHLEQLVAERHEPTPVVIPVVPAPKETGLIGRIDIARLNLSVIIIEGTSAKTLRRAVGHISGTALPGESGNVGLSGHRDTFFRPLEHVRHHDLITLTTPRGKFRYRVVSRTVVDPSDTAILDASDRESLTLVTCYPFTFIGSAPERFIVRAERSI